MTRDVITVDASDTIREVFNVFAQIKIRHVPVLEDRALVGIISHSDIAGLSQDASDTDFSKVDSLLDVMTVKQLMKGNPVTLPVHHTIKQAADIFLQGHFHALPVTDHNELVGIVTTTDLIKYMIRLSD
ncbi:CBS domain-containing protein [Reichenbachiella sp. 5M10]|uniref:CBS domain-containing protein n=1 Tax=Reichenbachiella sp. 5M10 TaxID=1889772 RepID=UPI001C885E1B|nr:CBS domain-containing protein [Reichenbachiella sp. 5M10]